MVLLSTPNVGFDAVVTASVYVIVTFVAIVILNKTPSAFSVRFSAEIAVSRLLLYFGLLMQIGFLVGVSVLILVMAFQGALYWVRKKPR